MKREGLDRQKTDYCTWKFSRLTEEVKKISTLLRQISEEAYKL